MVVYHQATPIASDPAGLQTLVGELRDVRPGDPRRCDPLAAAGRRPG